MDVEKRKKELKGMFQKVVEPLGYKFTPDEELVDFLLEQEVKIEKEAGAPFCPCQGRVNKRKEDMKIVCPCIPFHREHFDYMKMCWCGLYVHQDVEDPSKLRQISHEEFKKIKEKS